MQDGYLEAVDRAIQLDAAAKEAGKPHRNPTSGAYLLTESIRGIKDD